MVGEVFDLPRAVFPFADVARDTQEQIAVVQCDARNRYLGGYDPAVAGAIAQAQRATVRLAHDVVDQAAQIGGVLVVYFR